MRLPQVEVTAAESRSHRRDVRRGPWPARPCCSPRTRRISGRLWPSISKVSGSVVLQAEDGIDALEVAAEHNGRIDVLVTDLVMPRMSGPELATRLLAEREDLKVIYVSGYTPETMCEYGVPTGTRCSSRNRFSWAISRTPSGN